MEVKKSRGADLENLRVQGFLLGLADDASSGTAGGTTEIRAVASGR